jgi:ABC-type uncharacterized transport system substrate-binding protein
LGYVDEKNIVIESRSAEGKLDHLPDLATDLVRLKVDVFVTGESPGTQAAQQATRTIPLGFVASLASPRLTPSKVSARFIIIRNLK